MRRAIRRSENQIPACIPKSLQCEPRKVCIDFTRFHLINPRPSTFHDEKMEISGSYKQFLQTQRVSGRRHHQRQVRDLLPFKSRARSEKMRPEGSMSQASPTLHPGVGGPLPRPSGRASARCPLASEPAAAGQRRPSAGPAPLSAAGTSTDANAKTLEPITETSGGNTGPSWGSRS